MILVGFDVLATFFDQLFTLILKQK